jgi:hypothetical protein
MVDPDQHPGITDSNDGNYAGEIRSLNGMAMNFSAAHRGVHQHWHSIAALLLLAIASIGAPAIAAPAREAFDWTPERAPKGPLVIVISVPSQQAFVYRNGVRIGTSAVSTGMQGHETPGGVYRILQKRREHTSNLYDLPMPFMQRLTWDGIALHAGDLPGHPASHGCVLLPAPFAQILFDTTSLGDLVVIAVDDSQPAILPGLGMLTPVDAGTGATRAQNKGSHAFEWAPERAPAGPLSIVLSTTERQIVVLRNAVEIGRASIDGRDLAPMGTRVYVLLAGTRSEPSRVVPGRPARRWQELSVTAERPDLADAIATGRITVPAEFALRVYDALEPGATVVVTDEPLYPIINDITAPQTASMNGGAP